PLQVGQVGHVAGDERHPPHLLVGQDEAEPPGVLAEVVDEGGVAALQQVADDPAADAAVAAGQEHAHEVDPRLAPRCPESSRQDTIAARGGKGAPFPTSPTGIKGDLEPWKSTTS